MCSKKEDNFVEVRRRKSARGKEVKKLMESAADITEMLSRLNAIQVDLGEYKEGAKKIAKMVDIVKFWTPAKEEQHREYDEKILRALDDLRISVAKAERKDNYDALGDEISALEKLIDKRNISFN